MQGDDIFIVSAARTAIGSFGGSLAGVPLTELATAAVSAAISRSGMAAADIDHLVMGNVIPTEPADAYLSRVAAINAGMPAHSCAFNVNRLCGSGLQAIISTAQLIQSGHATVGVAAGAESMSRGPYLLANHRWGQRLGDGAATDYMNGILHDPWERCHMGTTAENIAKRHLVSREDQDALALESQRRAAHAIAQGYFDDQIAPVPVKVRRETRLFQQDENVRADTTLEQLARLAPIFQPDDGTVTAGNASSLNDGAAALVLASETAVREHGMTPMARLVNYAFSGVDPRYMGMGPVPAVQALLKRQPVSLSDIDVIEANEAFAAQALAVTRELDLDAAKVNPNGSGISLGHPVGATGAIITTKLIYELHRRQGRYGIATMCIGGGQGIALLLERA